jgi:hypothetical protein
MGVVKGVAKHKGKKMVNNTLDDAGVVGDVIDKHTTTGPLDAAEDKLDKTKKDVDKKTKKNKR